MTNATSIQPCKKPMPAGYRCQWYEGHEGDCRPEYEQRMSAYYYSFDTTGVEAVDRILSAVAHAGKGYHHTESWSEPFEPKRGDMTPFRGDSYLDWIQNAAKDAAEAFRRLDVDGGKDKPPTAAEPGKSK